MFNSNRINPSDQRLSQIKNKRPKDQIRKKGCMNNMASYSIIIII